MSVHLKTFLRIFLTGIVITGLAACNHPEHQHSARNQVDKNNKKQGHWVLYNDSVRVAEGSYQDDRREGLWTFWYPNGQTREEGHFRNGVRTGMWVEWYPNGDILWKGEYKKGIRQIEWNGARAEVTVLDGSRHTRVLVPDSVYEVKISLQNVPVSNLFVEVSSGSITPDEESPGLFHLATPPDTAITLAVGYIPDLRFRDFRNLVTEMEFKLRKVEDPPGSGH